MKKTYLMLVAALSIVGAKFARADDANPWEIRVRSTYLSMANKSDAFSALGINFPANAVTVNSKMIPEVDVSYSFIPNLVAELVLTVPQTQDVSLAGVGHLGTFKHLPPVLAAQYHFIPGGICDPYVGLGVNATLIYDANLSVAGVPLELSHHSFGVAGQAGTDIALGHGFFFNVDVKKTSLRSDVSVKGGGKLTTAKLDPWLLSAGLGWKF